MKQLSRGSKDIVHLGAEAEKLAMKVYPGQEIAATWQAMEAFICALEPKLALEVQKLGYCTLDKVTAATCRSEHLQREYPSLNMDSLMASLQYELKTKVFLKTKKLPSTINGAIFKLLLFMMAEEENHNSR